MSHIYGNNRKVVKYLSTMQIFWVCPLRSKSQVQTVIELIPYHIVLPQEKLLIVCAAFNKKHSRFSLFTDFRSTFIWREPKTHYLLFRVQEIDHYRSEVFMVCAGIILNYYTIFNTFESVTVNGVMYRDDNPERMKSAILRVQLILVSFWWQQIPVK